MLPHDVTLDSQLAPERIYISSSVEDLITVQMDAWERGYQRAAADGPAAIRDTAALERASEAACDEALLVYVPMDVTRFRDTFTLAWCGGYRTRVRESEKPTA